ncbi:MAG: hypothetical protein HYW07_02465 [Candidatus Latescibacteria bacterium]|nr:hypothetical protein [Candidatus Latescibacterota bacterium]
MTRAFFKKKPEPLAAGKPLDWLDFLAWLISHLFNPAMVAWGVFSVLVWLKGGAWWAGLAGVVFYSLVPGVALLYLYRTGMIADVYLPERSQRARLLPLGVAWYFAGLVVLWLVSAPAPMMGAGCAFCGMALLVWQIDRFWKISIHATGVGGGLGIVLAAAGWSLWPLSLSLPLVMWARLRLQAHTPAQVWGGAVLGGAASSLLLNLFFSA